MISILPGDRQKKRAFAKSTSISLFFLITVYILNCNTELALTGGLQIGLFAVLYSASQKSELIKNCAL